MASEKKDKVSRKRVVCERCNSRGAVYHQFGLNLCRRCFREMAPKMGFEKYE